MPRNPFPDYPIVGDCTEAALRERLVQDAVKLIATPLPWAVRAYERMGQLSRKGAEQAYQDVLDEVETLTGRRMLPLG